MLHTIAMRPQRTLACEASVAGQGFITGQHVSVRFHPAEEHTGIRFVRTDRPCQPIIPAHVSQVTDTRRRTTLGHGADSVTLVEHVLAALAGLRIDNCIIALDGPEPPGLDGSAGEFVRVLQGAGVVRQTAPRPIRAAQTPIIATHHDSTLALYPAATPGLKVSFLLDYGPMSPIGWQQHTVHVTPDSFTRTIADCRTFLLENEAQALRQQGIGLHLKPQDVLVYGVQGPLENFTRYADEPARHKVLDVIGDLALCGFDLAGHVVAYRSGHALNIELARQLTGGLAQPGGANPLASSESLRLRVA